MALSIDLLARDFSLNLADNAFCEVPPAFPSLALWLKTLVTISSLDPAARCVAARLCSHNKMRRVISPGEASADQYHELVSGHRNNMLLLNVVSDR